MLKISKYESSGRTFTNVTALNNNEMIDEVMRLIGTNEVSEYAYKHAEELIKEAKSYKKSLN
jgi:DNA repair ATPase RecN